MTNIKSDFGFFLYDRQRRVGAEMTKRKKPVTEENSPETEVKENPPLSSTFLTSERITRERESFWGKNKTTI